MEKRTRRIIDNSHNHQCYKCGGLGLVKTELHGAEECSTCNGTGVWIEEHFFLVTSDNKGNQICFDVDNLGK